MPRARPAPRRPIRGSGRTALVRGQDGGEAFPGGTPRGREASEPSRPPEGARSPTSRRARRRRTRPRRLPAVPLPSPLAAAVSHPADGLTMQPCSVGGRKGRCSTSRVHVNRATGSGPTIPIRVGVVPAIGSHRQPDPIVCFDGGLGSCAVDDTAQEMPQLRFACTTRDVVFIDQRCTGASNLTCPALPGLAGPSLLRAAVTLLTRTHQGGPALHDGDAPRRCARALKGLGYRTADLVAACCGATAAQVFRIARERRWGWTRAASTACRLPASRPPSPTSAAGDAGRPKDVRALDSGGRQAVKRHSPTSRLPR